MESDGLASGVGMATLEHYGNILLVEDDESLSRLMTQYLDRAGYEVAVEADGLAAEARIIDEQPDLVVLDIMLPGQDGLAVCRHIRPQYLGPVIVLTAKDQPIDEMIGLEVGADDYMVKPVDPPLLLSRIRAHLRRVREFSAHRHGVAAANPQVADILQVDHKNREVICEGRRLDLSGPEFNLLALLLEKPGHIFSRDEISLAMRGVEYDGYSRHIDILISNLRAKMDNPDAIKTVRNKGYLLVEHWPTIEH